MKERPLPKVGDDVVVITLPSGETIVARFIPYPEAIRLLTNCRKQPDADRLFIAFLKDHPQLAPWFKEGFKRGDSVNEYTLEVILPPLYRSWNRERKREYLRRWKKRWKKS